MITKKEIKQKLRQEFDALIPDVLSSVTSKRVVPTPLGFEINLKPKLVINLSKLVIAASLIIGVASFGGYSYYTPNTIMSISVTPTMLNTILRLSSPETPTAATGEPVNITIAVNDYERVVEIDADSVVYQQALADLKLNNKNYQVALQKMMELFNQNGEIDIDDNFGQVTFMVLDNNQNRVQRMNDYINKRLALDAGVKNQRMIVTENIEFDSSTNNLPAQVHPAKAMAIKEIMLRTNQYSFEQLAALDKMELIRIMMDLKRNKK